MTLSLLLDCVLVLYYGYNCANLLEKGLGARLITLNCGDESEFEDGGIDEHSVHLSKMLCLLAVLSVVLRGRTFTPIRLNN